ISLSFFRHIRDLLSFPTRRSSDLDRGLYWIFLEDGGRTLLRSFADVERWTVAARWAARFHAATRDLPEAQTSVPRRRSSEATSRSEEHTSELQSRFDLVCRLLLEK